MSEAEFRTKRRQKFLTEKYFNLNAEDLQGSISVMLDALGRKKLEGKIDSSTQDGIFKAELKLFQLNYTAGAPIESLKPLYNEAMRWFGAWHVAYGSYIQHIAKEAGEELRTDGTPLPLNDLFHYQLLMEVLSLGVLLGEADTVRRAAAWVSRYRHTDMLLEALIEPVVADPDTEISEFLHNQPYDALLDAVFTAETGEQAGAFVKTYLDGWYKAFEGVPWHNGHLVVTDEYSNYEGYWAFEAAAICVLYDIDDSSFRDHLVYPKDLADWARANNVVERLKPAAGAKPLQLRCEGGQDCPQTGFWSTPAQPNSRSHFIAGKAMPVIDGSAWGATIWYWDQIQS